uniref:Uncharacterized protein n=1 Tax=Pyrodinium bahamense TaxID=73915 RepID=A0A7S0AEI4_9DINO|eukprot:CAMPEP_0179142274 /NCGR_PEP_ID=MMETSP0796-20121207/68315_1 /TAXON_ID=73915 /ORGANISM="Pyrodinium bahamense, Strain pbaha01" /LENGTH=260 /DNA_ID=CAMNT_0020842119 /DNA_START=80 /DNA_END=862 /DNA_ORIENTATION=-
MANEEVVDTPLLPKQLARLVNESEETMATEGDMLEGEVTAWYEGQGLLGENYGFVCRSVQQDIKLANGLMIAAQVEHYRFDGDSLTQDCRDALLLRWRGLRVRFRSGGRDACGRRQAVDITRARPARPQQRAAQDPPPAVPAPRLPRSARPDAEAAAGAAAEVAKGLVLKALRRLGGEATKAEVVAKIRSSPKLFAAVEEQLKAKIRSSGGELAWEEFVAKNVKKVCVPTGGKREGLQGADAKLFRVRDAPEAGDDAAAA